MTNKVSVVMCTFNGEKYLREQIDSILLQTYPLYEIIVCDDCSTDNTWMILQGYKSQYPNLFKCTQNDSKLGYGLNFKLAMSYSTGDYIAFSDQDDIWMPNKIEALIKVIGDKFLVVSNSEVLDSARKENVTLFQKTNPYTTIEKLIWDNNIYGHAIMINSSLLKYINEVKVETAHDAMIAIICYSVDSVAITDEKLQVWRRHSQTVTYVSSSTNKGNSKRTRGYYKFLYAMYSIAIGRRSNVIQNGFENINCILSLLSEEKNVSKNIGSLICKN